MRSGFSVRKGCNTAELRELRRGLLGQYDEGYLGYLRRKGKEYGYKREYSLLKDAMSVEEYGKWRENRWNSLTDREDV